jgi:hypothetical protein
MGLSSEDYEQPRKQIGSLLDNTGDNILIEIQSSSLNTGLQVNSALINNTIAP